MLRKNTLITASSNLKKKDLDLFWKKGLFEKTKSNKLLASIKKTVQYIVKVVD